MKLAEGNNSSIDTLVLSNQQILNFLKESASTRENNYEMVQLRMQKKEKKNIFKRNGGKNRILLANLNPINDSNTRQFIQSEQARIIQKNNSTTR